MYQPCVFCGSTAEKNAKEHILAKWVARLYPVEAAMRVPSLISSNDGSATTLYYSHPFEQTVKAVCGPCNHGWMNRLETSVAPILGPMMLHGRPTRLRAAEQRSIATWATKTAFMFQQLHPTNRVVPEAECHRLYDFQQPPPGYHIFLANRFDLRPLIRSKEQRVTTIGGDETLTAEQLIALANKHFAFRVTFTVGHVVLIVFGHDFPGGFTFSASSTVKVIQRIWPLPVTLRVRWPPPTSVEGIGGLDAAHDIFNPPPQSPR